MMVDNGIPNNWQVEKETITKQLEYILKTGLHADCEFVVGGDDDTIKTFKAHKLILVSASPVFEAMFVGGLAEKESVKIPDVQPEAFEKMLEFIYTGETTFQSIEEACVTYYPANKYILKKLSKYCVQYCLQNLNAVNICICHKYSLIYKITVLQTACLSWMCWKINEVIENRTFKDADYSALEYILSRDSLNISSELQIFKIIEQYAEGISEKILNDSSSALENHEQRSPKINGLIKKVRFLSMSITDFANGTNNSNLLTDNEKYTIMMNLLIPESQKMPDGFDKSRTRRVVRNVNAFNLQSYLDQL